MTEARRTLLQAELEGYLANRVSNPEDHVSFQPQEGTKIPYPHIVYSLDPAYKLHADNITYLRKDKYEVTLIDRKAGTQTFEDLDNRPYTDHKSSFRSDGLYHYVFDLYH